jgi:2-C-methyl-D-erythritol 4-phosphate cytidylyltransferase
MVALPAEFLSMPSQDQVPFSSTRGCAAASAACPRRIGGRGICAALKAAADDWVLVHDAARPACLPRDVP